MMIKGIGSGYVIGLVSLVFTGIITFSFLANEILVRKLIALNQKVGLAVNNARSSFMDALSPHIGSFYFWIPFYCALLLVMIGFDKIRFRLNCFCIGAYLIIAGIGTLVLNLIASRLMTTFNSRFHYPYTAGSQLDHSLICLRATLTFGTAVFSMVFLNRRFRLVKVSLLIFSLILIYDLMYLGTDLPGTLLFGMIAGALAAVLCGILFRNLNGEYSTNFLFNLINTIPNK